MILSISAVKRFGNGFPVTALAVLMDIAPVIEKILASSSYGGNPMACVATLESISVVEVPFVFLYQKKPYYYIHWQLLCIIFSATKW